MSKINSINEALQRLDALMNLAGTTDEELKQFIQDLHSEKQGLLQRLSKMRQRAAKADTTSSMHTKLTEALRE